MVVVIPKSSFKRFVQKPAEQGMFRATSAGPSSIYFGDPDEGAAAECVPLAHVSMEEGDSVLVSCIAGIYYVIGKI